MQDHKIKSMLKGLSFLLSWLSFCEIFGGVNFYSGGISGFTGITKFTP